MSEILQALQDSIIAHVPAIVTALLTLLGAAAAWAVGWLRAHTAASAVRQAVDQYGDTPMAAAAARSELRRVPRVMRPGNLDTAVTRARNIERIKRVSAPPRRDGGVTAVDIQDPYDIGEDEFRDMRGDE